MSDLTGIDRSRVSRIAERLVAHRETIAHRQPIWRRPRACLPGHLGPAEGQPNFGDGVERQDVQHGRVRERGAGIAGRNSAWSMSESRPQNNAEDRDPRSLWPAPQQKMFWRRSARHEGRNPLIRYPTER
jgi:hypothetical protein